MIEIYVMRNEKTSQSESGMSLSVIKWIDYLVPNALRTPGSIQ
jgi:hypothetical protein